MRAGGLRTACRCTRPFSSGTVSPRRERLSRLSYMSALHASPLSAPPARTRACILCCCPADAQGAGTSPARLSACLPTRLRSCVRADARSTCAFRLSHRTQAPARLDGSRPPHPVCQSPPAHLRTPYHTRSQPASSLRHLKASPKHPCLVPRRVNVGGSREARERRAQGLGRGRCGPPTCAQG